MEIVAFLVEEFHLDLASRGLVDDFYPFTGYFWCILAPPPWRSVEYGEYRFEPKRTIKERTRIDYATHTGTREDWVAKLRGADIVSAPINTLLEASNDPDVIANGYVTEVEHPRHKRKLKVHGTPWQFSETPAKPGIAPELGEHNEAVLGGLGYSAAEIADFKSKRII